MDKYPRLSLALALLMIFMGYCVAGTDDYRMEQRAAEFYQGAGK